MVEDKQVSTENPEEQLSLVMGWCLLRSHDSLFTVYSANESSLVTPQPTSQVRTMYSKCTGSMSQGILLSAFVIRNSKTMPDLFIYRTVTRAN